MEDAVKAAMDFFPNFEITKINNHLRRTKNVSEEVHRAALNTTPGVPNKFLMSDSTIPSNIAEGYPMVDIQDKHFIPTLEECLTLTEGLKTMIVVDTRLADKYRELRKFVQTGLDLSSLDEETLDDTLIFSGNFHLLKKYIESFGGEFVTNTTI